MKARAMLTFNHAMIYVRNLRRALQFYQGLLGFKLIEAFPGYARLRSPIGQTTIALHKLEPGQAAARNEGIRLCFETKDLDRLCARVVAAGGNIPEMPKKMPWGWKHAYLKDPDGHELSLYWAGEKRLRKTARA